MIPKHDRFPFPAASQRWTPRSILQRTLEVIQKDGIKVLCFKVLGETVYRRVILLERSLGEPVIDVKAKLPVVIDRLREAEIDEYGVLRPEIDPTEVSRRIGAGHQCFVARYKGRLIHACWVTAGRAWIDTLSFDIQLARDEAYSYEAFTMPEFRGQNVYAACLTTILLEFRNAGYRRLLMVIVPENKIAFQPPAKTGFRPIGKMKIIQVGPWRHFFCRMNYGLRPLARFSHSSLPGYWDAVARSMNERPHYLDSFMGEMKRQAHLALLQRWGGGLTGRRLLKTDLFEEAIGPDSFLADLTDMGRAVGIDISGVIVAQARQRFPGSSVSYVTADVRHLPFIDGAFSLILSPSTLDHFADPADLGHSLSELRRILEPGGRLIITIDNRQNIFNPLLKLANRAGWLPYLVGHPLTIKELRHALTSAGFRVLDATAIMHNPRLVAVGMMRMARAFGWKPLIRFCEKTLLASQKLEKTSVRYWTGSFIAAHAIRFD